MKHAWLGIGVLVLTASPCFGQNRMLEGLWRTEDGEGVVEISACANDASARCGKIVWIKTATDAEGKPLRDAKNPDEALNKRPICGLEVITGMKSQADGGYAGGKVYDPEEGKSYNGTLKMIETVLKVTGFVELPIIGKVSSSDVWSRIASLPERCK